MEGQTLVLARSVSSTTPEAAWLAWSGRAAIAGAGVAPADLQMTGREGMLPIQPLSAGLPDRIWWGSGTRASARWGR